jgi:cytochrome c oxidase cbb3-type subunit 3
MQATSRSVVSSLMVLLAFIAGVATVGAGSQQTGAQAPAAPRIPPFPAQMRTPDDPAVVERGRTLYNISCRSCHGADLRGGDMGGPNLLRSAEMLNDINGERLAPILKGSRAGMPPIDLADADATAVASYIHSVLARGAAQGAPPLSEPKALEILVGDAAAGQAYFNAKCATCHSASGDLRGIATRVADPVQLQNLWVGGGIADRRLDPDGPKRRADILATVTPASGPAVQGRLERIDDFSVTLLLDDGTRRTFRRNGDVPHVDVRDPLAGHVSMLSVYTDHDIHNVTAFLVTLK